MRRKRWAVAPAIVLALAAPAGLEAAVLRSEDAAAQLAAVAATPTAPVAGQVVRVTLLTPLEGRVRWLVDGTPLATRGKSALVEARTSGRLRIEAKLRRSGRVVATGAATIAVRAPRPAVAHASAPRRRVVRKAVHGAQAASVTIRDFQFSPASISVHVGDTVTWLNNGPSAHTATASNGGFDTGALRAGQSGSHTFTQAGTYSYICSFHPFMHGTVVVVGSAASSTPTQRSAASTPTQGSAASTPVAPAATGQTNGSSLPMTGLDIAPVVAAGGLLLVSGAALRRKLR